MITDIFNRMRPETRQTDEPRPEPATQAVPETSTTSFASSPASAHAPIDAARVSDTRGDDTHAGDTRVDDTPPSDWRGDEASQEAWRAERTAEEDRAFAQPRTETVAETAPVAGHPAMDQPVMPQTTDATAVEATTAEAEADAREDTDPQADTRGYALGTADWRYSRADTRRRLPREETDTLICSGKVEGTHVYDQAGKRMGRVETVMLNKTSGQIEYAVVRLPGGLVSGETYRPVAWSDLRYDTAAGGYQIDTDRQALKRDRSFEEGR